MAHNDDTLNMEIVNEVLQENSSPLLEERVVHRKTVTYANSSNRVQAHNSDEENNSVIH